MTTPELAEYLAVSEDAIRNWVKKGEIPFSKLGRALRFDLLEIEKWLKTKQTRIQSRIYSFFMCSFN